MADLAAGSEDAAWKLAEVYTPHILRVVRASLPTLIRPKLDSQDFAQAVWASLLVKRTYLAQVQTQQQLIALLAATARHKVLDAYRHYAGTQGCDVRREKPLRFVASGRRGSPTAERGLVVRDPSPSQTASLRERWTMIIGRCSPRDQQILALRIKGNSYAEIGQVLGIGGTTARRIVDRIIHQLSE